MRELTIEAQARIAAMMKDNFKYWVELNKDHLSQDEIEEERKFVNEQIQLKLN